MDDVINGDDKLLDKSSLNATRILCSENLDKLLSIKSVKLTKTLFFVNKNLDYTRCNL